MQNKPLFHVTPAVNAGAILREGVRPNMSEGKMQVSWWVEEHMIAWALAHVSYRRAIAVSSLAVCIAPLGIEMPTRTRWRGVYHTRVITPIEKVSSAYNFLSE